MKRQLLQGLKPVPWTSFAGSAKAVPHPKTVRVVAVMLLIAASLCLTGCSPIENQARDTAAALSGSLVAAQAKYQGTCGANPAQSVCEMINRGVSGENALVSAIETYCGWDAANPDALNGSAKCVPVKSAQAVLEAAIANATTLTLEIKGAI